MSQEEFNIMPDRACNLKTKNPTINVTIMEKRSIGEKDNIDDETEEDDQRAKKGKKVSNESFCTILLILTYIEIKNE